MTSTKIRVRASLLALAALTLPACGDDESGKESAACVHGTLEGDLDADVFTGPAVGPDGKLQHDPNLTYTVSTTYGRPVPGADGAPVSQLYIDTFGDIQTTLQNSPGLLALTLATSDACGSGRTLAVWRSEDDMYSFVTSPAHLAAITNVDKLVQPGYAVTHYTAKSADQVTFAEASRQLAKVQGR